MKKRIKYLIILLILIGVIFIVGDTVLKAKAKKDALIVLEKDKIASKSDYSVKRNNNKYTVKSSKLEKKTFSNIFYDDTSVYLYYDGESTATLLKYNVEENKVIVLYEDSEELHGGLTSSGSYYVTNSSVYNKKFEKVIDYPKLGENEIIFPNFKKSLIKTDTGINVKNLDTLEEKEIIANSLDITYSPLEIKSDGKYILLNKKEGENNYIVVMDNTYKVINTIDSKYDEDLKKYKLLDDVPYLLETSIKNDKETYKLYNTRTLDTTYRSIDDLSNYIFYNTKFVCNDKYGNIKLIDYVTSEEKTLITKDKKEIIPKNFILASDNYSLVLTTMNDTNSFYIYYL